MLNYVVTESQWHLEREQKTLKLPYVIKDQGHVIWKLLCLDL